MQSGGGLFILSRLSGGLMSLALQKASSNSLDTIHPKLRHWPLCVRRRERIPNSMLTIIPALVNRGAASTVIQQKLERHI
jgi:hypothetical protein